VSELFGVDAVSEVLKDASSSIAMIVYY